MMISIRLSLWLLIVAPLSAGQPYTVSFDVVYEKPILQPGESQTITIVAMTGFQAGKEYIIQNSPVKWLNGTKGTLRGLANGLFDIVNVGNGEQGTFTNYEVQYPWDLQGYNKVPGRPDGVGGIKGIQASQAELLQIPDPPFGIPYELQEPAVIWQGTWTPQPRFAGDVLFTTKISDEWGGVSPSVHVESDQVQGWVADRWAGVHNTSAFMVVPAPGGMAWSVILALCGCRRRQRR